MVHIGNEIAAQIANASSKGVPKDASIQLKTPLPDSMQGKVIKGKVEIQNSDGTYKVSLPSGKTVDAQINPPPKIGSQISFIQLKTGETKLTEMVVDTFKDTPKNSAQEKGSQTPTQQNNQHSVGQKNASLQQTNASKTTTEQPQITNQNLNQTATKVSEPPKQDPFATLRPLVGQNIQVKSLDGKPLPTVQNALTVVVSKNENGQQTLRPQQPNSPLPTFKASFDIKVPEQTILKLNINNTQAKILEITPPKGSIESTNQSTASVQTATPKPNLTPMQSQAIILSAKVSQPTNLLPQGSLLHVQNIESSEPLPPLTQNITNASGHKTQETIPQFKTIFHSPSGQKFEIVSQVDIPKNTPLQLQNTNQGIVVKQVLNETLPIQNNPKASQIQIPNNQPVIAQVTNNLSSSMVSIKLENGVLAEVKTPIPLPNGTNIQVILNDDGLLEILPQSIPKTLSKATTLTEMANQWQNLKQSIEVLQKLHPESAQNLKENIPHIGKESFLPKLISFIDSVNHQSLQRLSGDETLNLLKAIGIDFSHDLTGLHNATQKNTETPENWRALIFPYLENDSDDPKQGGFFWHQSEDDSGKKTGTRFLTHVHLNGLGETQLDGYIQEKDIHLKLTTETPLDESEVFALKSIVGQTLENMGYTGGIEAYVSDKKLENPIQLALGVMNKHIQSI